MVQSDARTVEQRAEPELLRIDDLAQRSGVPSRTIRFYNTQGLLPAPIMRGRVAFYEQEHVTVLRIIRELKEQQHLPLEVIKELLDIRARSGDIQMNLAFKRRFTRNIAPSDKQLRLSKEELAARRGMPITQIDELTGQELLFPQEIEGQIVYSEDDLQLVELYQHFEELGLPLSLPLLIRFQLKQLARSEIAAYEQHVIPHWRDEGLSLEEQTEQFEHMLLLTDTLLSVMHKKLLYQI